MLLTSCALSTKKPVTEAGDSFSYNPIGAGTGPYEFVSWSSGNNIILRAYEDYWRGPASIKDVEIPLYYGYDCARHGH